MALKSLNQFLTLRNFLMRWRVRWLRTIVGCNVDLSIRPSLSSRINPRRRGSITIGSDTLIAFKTLIYTYDPLTGTDRPVRIGSRCFIGGGSMILPGVTIGNECIVGGGSVVFEDVPDRCIVGGNPARVLKRDMDIGPYGRLKGADENIRRLWKFD